MSRLICIIITFSLSCSFTSKGQVNLLDKMVQLPKGKITLKAALSLIEKQNVCIFSYDPTKIEDKQTLNINASISQTLSATLKQILPIQIKYKQTGKFIVLQKNTKGQATLLDASLKPLSLNQQEKILSTDIKIQHKADMSTPEDYLMPRPIETKSDTSTSTQDPLTAFTIKVDSFSLHASKNYAYPSSDSQTLQKNQGIGIKDSITALNSTSIQTLKGSQDSLHIFQKTDTVIIQPINSFGDFIKKRAILEFELAVNRELATFSLHTGLYGVYTIISYTKVNNNNSRKGIGMGSNFKIWKNVGAGIELISNKINNGIAEKIGINTNITQLSTELSYTFTNRYKLFVRPNIYVLKSIYTSKAKEIIKVTGVKKTEDNIKVEDTSILLSNYSGIGGVIGISIDLNNLFFKN
jgi:hypothetical protein